MKRLFFLVFANVSLAVDILVVRIDETKEAGYNPLSRFFDKMIGSAFFFFLGKWLRTSALIKYT